MTLLILNTETLSPEQELVQDLLAIVHCFSARLYGLRNYCKVLQKALTMERSHKIRLNPTPEQATYFRRACGTARFVYNWALNRVKENRASGIRQPLNEIKKAFNAIKGAQFPWVYEVTKCAAEQEFTNLNTALTNFFTRQKKGTLPRLKKPCKDGEMGGFPRFKSLKRDRPSFYIANDKFRVDGHAVLIPKLGWVHMTEALRFDGTIMSATVSFRAGWWWVAIQVTLLDQVYKRDGRITGIDVGIKTFVVASTGEIFENQKHLAQAQAKLRRLQKSLSRKQKESANAQKAKARLAKAHYKVACQREDRQHKVLYDVARTYTYIGMEDLNVKGMVRNHKLARALSDAAFGRFKQFLTYKAEQRSGMVIEVGRFFASSKLCHTCGYQNEDLTLAIREWTCFNPDCRTTHDRDVNAAINIHREAERLLMASR